MQNFETIMAQYSRPIYNFVYRLCGDREEATDITQDVFLRVWKYRKNFDARKNFKTWIFAIARNTAIDWLRRKKSYVFSEMTTVDDDISFEETLADTEPLPDELFERKNLDSQLENALEKLNLDERALLILHDMEDLTFEEIGTIVGKPLNTVKSQYRRTLIKLRTLLT